MRDRNIFSIPVEECFTMPGFIFAGLFLISFRYLSMFISGGMFNYL